MDFTELALFKRERREHWSFRESLRTRSKVKKVSEAETRLAKLQRLLADSSALERLAKG